MAAAVNYAFTSSINVQEYDSVGKSPDNTLTSATDTIQMLVTASHNSNYTPMIEFDPWLAHQTTLAPSTEPYADQKPAITLCHKGALKEHTPLDWDFIRPIAHALYKRLALPQVMEVLKNAYGFKIRQVCPFRRQTRLTDTFLWQCKDAQRSTEKVGAR